MISTLSGGGAESVCVSIANIFADNDWQVDLVVLNLNNEAYLNRLSKKVNLIVLKVNHARYSILSLLKYIYKNKVKKILVFNYELTVILVALRIFLKLRIKIIARNMNTLSLKIKEFDEQNLWTRYIVKPFVKNFYSKTDYIVNQCNGMRNDLINEYPQLNKKSNVIYNPLQANIIDFLNTNDLTKIKKKNYILCIGRLEKQKAMHYAIESFAGIVDNFPNLRLKIVGKGSLEKNLKQKAVDCKVESKVDFEGFQKNLVEYYLYAKATVLTSLYEGYPNVLIESIALNTPVVAFDCPNGPNEIIKDGINGFLVKHKDIDDLKKKLSIIITNKYNIENLQSSINQNQIKKVFQDYEKLIYSFD